METTDRDNTGTVPAGVPGIPGGNMETPQEPGEGSPAFEAVERVARCMCEDVHGKGSWDVPHRKKAVYRQRAMSLIRKRDRLAADAFFSLFNVKQMVP